jgi:tagatose 6-phosphate kinase
LTLGEEGALLACPEGLFSARPPAIQAINPIACGDAMTAGLLVGLDGGKSPHECLRLATAVAAANALTWDACDLTLEVIQQYLPRVEVVRLADSPRSFGSLEA